MEFIASPRMRAVVRPRRPLRGSKGREHGSCMGEIRSISRSHFMSIAGEPFNPRGRECLAGAAVFLAKSDVPPFLSDLAHNGAVPRYRVGVFMKARAADPKHGPRSHWPDAGFRQC